MSASHALVAGPLAGTSLPALGNLDAYIQAVNKVPLLSAEEEADCARRFQEEQDLHAARTLVMSHLRLVVSISRQYLGYGLPQADLIQEGNIGLMKAVKRFDPSRGVRLVSFALHWIKAELHEYILKNWRLVKVATTKAQRKLFFNLRSLKQDARTLTPTHVADIAAQLNVREQDVVEMETRLGGQDVSLEPLGSSDDERESPAPVNYLAAPAAEPSEVLDQRREDRLRGEGIQAALEGLDERSRNIVEARWLNVDEGGGRTLQDLATEYGVSAERIRQIEAKALKKMKSALSQFQ